MADVGEVRYKATVDAVNTEEEIKKVEKVIGDAAESASKKVDDAASKSSQKVKDSAKGVGDEVGKSKEKVDQFSDALGKVKGGPIDTLNGTIKETKSAISGVNEALDKTPKGFNAIGLAAEKLRLTKEAVSETKEKLGELKDAQEKAKQAFKDGEISKDTYKAISREVMETKSDLKEMKNEGKEAIKELANTAAATTGIEKIGDAAKKAGSIGLSAFKAIGTAFVGLSTTAAAGVVALTKTSLENYASYEQLVGGVETLFGESAATVEAYADRAYKTAGLSANAYTETVTSFSASLLQSLGGDTEKAAEYADRAVTDMADNANKMGTDIASIQYAYQGFAKQNYTMLDNLKLGYGGTKEEMRRLIADAAKMTDVQKKLGVTVDASSLSFGNIVNAISVMQESMGIAGTTAKEASSTIEGSVNSVKGAWENLTVAIADENADVGESLEEFVDAVGVAGENILPRVEAILDGIGHVMEGLPPIIADGLTVLLEQSPQFVETALSLVSSFLDAIKSSGPQVTDGAVDLILTLVEGFVSMVPDIIETSGTLILGLIEGLTDHAPEIVATAGELVKNLASGLVKFIPQIIRAMGELAAAIVDALTDVDWIQVGKDVISGIIKGIGSMAGALWDAAKNIASSALDAIRGVFDSHSPSKAAERIADTVPQGVVKSFDDDTTVKEAGRRLGEEAVSALSVGVDYTMPDVREAARALTADMTASARVGAQITVPVTIDGREVARATAWYTGEQLAWEER